MRIGEHLLWAPGIRFSELDLDGPSLPEQYHARIDGYYLGPAEICVSHGAAFAAGLLSLTAVDAMSKLYFGPNRYRRTVSEDFRTFVKLRLPSFASDRDSDTLYYQYRNGLVHEARIKNGGEFRLDQAATLEVSTAGPIVDPARLLTEVRAALDQLVAEMKGSAPFRREFTKLLKREFAFELQDAV